MSLNKRIRQLREESALSQSEFAVRLGVTRATISQIELGNQLPTIKMLPLIVKNFNVDYEWLIDGVADNKDSHKGKSLITNNIKIDSGYKDTKKSLDFNTNVKKCSRCLALESIIDDKNELIDALKETNKVLKARANYFEKKDKQAKKKRN